ncbi:DUF1800 domain-containing protein [soil metagenome]
MAPPVFVGAMAPDQSPDHALIAHLLRRTGFGPAPGEVEMAGSYDEALAAVLDTAADDGVEMPDPDPEVAFPGVLWWLRRMQDSPAPLHDKLVLFWHSHVPSSTSKAPPDLLARQHNLLRRNAQGNFRTLMRGIVQDAAMQLYLDGAGSDASAPNENLARELMELFTLGRGNYTEGDVRAAAKALAGFTVDRQSGAVGFDSNAANDGRLTILGVTDTFDAERVVDVVCDQPACAEFIAAKLYRFFVGVAAPDSRRAELAASFRAGDLEIMPLVEQILTGPEFAQSRLTRARLPVEWFVAAHAAFDRIIAGEDVWKVGELGQMPFLPPNVAGWPVGPEWAGAGRQLLRASMALGLSWDERPIDLEGSSPATRSDSALKRCGLFEVARTTRSALEVVADQLDAAGGGDRALVAAALASPEAACC